MGTVEACMAGEGGRWLCPVPVAAANKPFPAAAAANRLSPNPNGGVELGGTGEKVWLIAGRNNPARQDSKLV